MCRTITIRTSSHSRIFDIILLLVKWKKHGVESHKIKSRRIKLHNPLIHCECKFNSILNRFFRPFPLFFLFPILTSKCFPTRSLGWWFPFFLSCDFLEIKWNKKWKSRSKHDAQSWHHEGEMVIFSISI